MSRDARARDGRARRRPRATVFKCCSGYRAQQREIIMKVKGKAGTKSMRHALAVQKIMSLLEMGVVADLNTGIAVFKRRIDKDKLEKLIAEGKFDEAMDIIPWDKLPDDIERVSENLEKAVIRGSQQSIKTLPAPSVSAIVGTSNPRIRRFISDQVGNLVVGIRDDSRKSIQNAVTQSFEQGLTPRRAASLMQESVGLTEKQNIRVMNRQLSEFAKRDKLQARLTKLQSSGSGSSPTALKIKRDLANLTDDKIQLRTEKFAKNMQKQRNVTIARTELTRATNQGQVETWLSAANEGLIDRDQARKVWVVVPDDRLSNICADLDGKSVPLDGKFFVEQTGETIDGPPAHPNCRSALALKFGEEE